MRNVRTNYAVVGGFVLAMTIAMIVVVAMLTGRTGATDTYLTTFGNVTGVKFGTKVSYEGFVVGQVDDIVPLREDGVTRYQLKLAIRQGWPVPKDSITQITAPGLLAAVIVDIKGGYSSDLLKPGTEITSGGNANLFAMMSAVAGQVSDLSQTTLKPLLVTLNAEIGKAAPQLLANLAAVTGDLAEKTPRITADVQRMTGTLSNQVVTDANAQRMAKTLENVSQLSGGLDDSRRKLDNAITTIDKVVAGNRDTMDATLKDLRYTLQTVARSIDSVTYNLEGTTRNFNEFSRQLRDNPAVLINGRRTEDGPAKQ